jgi:hypothetical protein
MREVTTWVFEETDDYCGHEVTVEEDGAVCIASTIGGVRHDGITIPKGDIYDLADVLYKIAHRSGS